MISTLAIDKRLNALIAMQKPHVESVCAKCSSPCCARVQHLYNEMDVIYLKLSKGTTPPRRKRKRQGCAFHSASGCLLEPPLRPFTCHRYICPALEQAIAAQAPALLPALQNLIKEIDELRSDLWKTFLEREKRK